MPQNNRQSSIPPVAGRRLINTRERKLKTGNPSEMTLWRQEQAGIGPQPVRINGRRFWFEDEVDAFLEQLAADRRKLADRSILDASEDEESRPHNNGRSQLNKRQPLP